MPAPPSSPPLGWQPYTFCIAGVQKSGTSTLSALLDAHVNIAKAPRKEIHYFDDDTRDWSSADHSGYRVPRRRRVHTHMGDATPRYLAWPGALERIRSVSPAMRMIAIFRDPLDRLFSHWMMLRSRHGAGAPDWSEFTSWRPAGMPTSIPADLRGRADRKRFQLMSGVIRGYYGSQVRAGLSLFPRDQWLFLDFASFLADHRAHLDLTTDFLGLTRYQEHPPLRRLMTAPDGVTGATPTGAELLGLARLYEPEMEEFAKLSALPVQGWSTTRVLSGALDPEELAQTYATKAGRLR